MTSAMFVKGSVPLVRLIFPRLTGRKALSDLSYYHKPSTRPLLPFTAGKAVDRAADAYGDAVAVTSCHQDLRKTYTEYKKDIDGFAAGLVSLNLPVGSKIGILMPNMYEWAVAQFAVAKAGLISVNLSPAYHVPELEYCLTSIDCDAIITTDEFSKRDRYTMLLEIVPELESAKPGELYSSRLPRLKHVIFLGDQPKPGTRTFDDITKSATSDNYKTMERISSSVQSDDVMNVQFTSGTTGKSKGALLSHFSVFNNASSVGYQMEYDKQHHSICLSVPLVHCFGCAIGTVAAMLFGATVVIPAPRFNATAALRAITTEKCTTVYGTPTMYIDMMREFDNGQYNVSSLSQGVIGGAPCPPDVVRTAVSRLSLKRMHVLYGTTECSPVITSTNPNEPLEEWVRTVGRPIDHVEVKIVDKDNRMVPLNTEGELCARGYIVFQGYYGAEQKTREVLRNNWYHTGDEATMDEDGRIKICGRVKDMIIRGGENIYPREIEDFLYTHPDIEEVQVFGVPDTRLGEEVCAWVKVRNEKELTRDDIKMFCEEQISHFKIPKYVLFVDNFPTTLSGKLQKFKMREETIRRLNLQQNKLQ